MKYFENKYTRFQEIKKNAIQAVATLVTNANLKGFFDGKIYKGNTKVACVPGLNCYSCPGAIGSCPIGSLQAVIGSKKFIILCNRYNNTYRCTVWKTCMWTFMSVRFCTGFTV